MTHGRIPTLDGLRAVAILIVIGSHAKFLPWQFGHMGVMIFFSLSGYLITTRLLHEYRKTGRISLRDFYLRRAFRILPPATIYISVVALLVSLGVVTCSWPAIAGALLFYINYIDASGWQVGHFWSLSVEEHFYLLWPCLLICFGVLTGWRTAAALAVAMLFWRLGDNHFHIVSQTFNAPYLQESGYRTDLIADTLLWGCCLAFVRVRLRAVVSTVIAVASAILMVWMVIGIPELSPRTNGLVQNMHFLPSILLLAILSCPTAPIGRLLDLAPMRFIGNISYSLYIWQQLFVGGDNKLPIELGVLASFSCAYLSFRFIEKPIIEIGRTIINRDVGAASLDKS